MSAAHPLPLPDPPRGFCYFRDTKEILRAPELFAYQHMLLRAWEEMGLSGVLTGVKVVWSYDGQQMAWKQYKPSAGSANTLSSMEPGKGYWIYTANGGTINMAGWGSLASKAIYLYDGWNLIGYNGNRNGGAAVTLNADGHSLTLGSSGIGNGTPAPSVVTINADIILGAIILSCGLLYPWALIRSTRYAQDCLRAWHPGSRTSAARRPGSASGRWRYRPAPPLR